MSTQMQNNHEAHEAQEGEHVREKLPAEIFFDKAVYGGISYFAQAAAGIALTYWIRESGGRRYFDKMSQWAAPLMTKITGKTGKEAVDAANTPIVVSTMIMCGNAFLLPVKWLENRKPQIVRTLNDRHNARLEAQGHAPTPEEREHQEQVLGELEREPKQTWSSLLEARFFGLAAVYGAVFGIGTPNNLRMEKFVSETVRDAAGAVGAKSLAKNSAFDKILRLTTNDMFYSTVSAGGLYVYSHFIRPPKKDKGEADSVAVGPLEESALYALGLDNEIDGKNPGHAKPRPATAHHKAVPSQHLQNVHSLSHGALAPEVAP